MEIGTGRVEVNGLTFHYLEAGRGPLVLCLHGFPDNAYTYNDLLLVLAQAGFRVADNSDPPRVSPRTTVEPARE